MSQTEWSLFEAFVELIRTTGLLGAALLVIVGFWTGRIARGSDLKDARDELKEERAAHERTRVELFRWVSVYQRVSNSAEHSTSLAEKVIPPVEETP